MKYVRFCFKRYFSSADLDAKVENVKLVVMHLYEHYSSLVLDTMEGVDVSQTRCDVKITDVGVSNAAFDEHNEDWQQFLKEEETAVIKSLDLDRYLQDAVEDASPNFDILAWWKMKASTYRVLSHMAHDILPIPISTIASESAFSTRGRLLDQFRNF